MYIKCSFKYPSQGKLNYSLDICVLAKKIINEKSELTLVNNSTDNFKTLTYFKIIQLIKFRNF